MARLVVLINNFFRVLLRISAMLLLLTAAGLIAFGCVLQTPPKAPIPAACVFIGTLTILCSIFGFVGASGFRPGFLFMYIVMGSSVLTLQLMIVAVMYIEPQHIVDRIVAIDQRDQIQDYTREGIAEKVNVGRVIFLVVLILEAIGLTVATIMRAIGDLDNPYRQDFAELEPGIAPPETSRRGPVPDEPSAAGQKTKPAAFSVKTPSQPASRVAQHELPKHDRWDRL